MKRKVRLTESDLHNIIKESVKGILNEEFEHYKTTKIYTKIRERWLNFGTILYELSKNNDEIKWVHERFVEFYHENEKNLELLHAAYKEELKNPDFKSGVMGL